MLASGWFLPAFQYIPGYPHPIIYEYILGEWKCILPFVWGKKKVNTDAKTLHIMHIKAKYKLFLKLSAVVAYCCQCGLFY